MRVKREEEEDNFHEQDENYKVSYNAEAIKPLRRIPTRLDDNEEVQDTLDWLHENGVQPPPNSSPDAENEVEVEPTNLMKSTKYAPWSTTSKKSPRSSSPARSSTTLSSTGPIQANYTESSSSKSLSFTPSEKLSTAQHAPTGLTTVSERTQTGDEDVKSTFSSSTVSDAQSSHSSFSPEMNSTFTSPNEIANTTDAPTPTYSPSRTQNACKLPKLNPWDPSIKHLLDDVGNDPGCRNGFPPPAFDVNANRLVLTGEVDTSSIDFDQVTVETIHRNDDDDNYVHFVNRGNPFDTSEEEIESSKVINESDFFKLTYKMKTGKENTYYFARVAPQPNAMNDSRTVRQTMKQRGRTGYLDLNVVMIGFDSVSTASFLRKMPKSLDVLRASLKTYFISGQTVIGDATTPALTAMLTGAYETDLPEGRQGYDNSAPIDNWPWLMKLYKEHGYVTLMAEDDPSMGAFNLRLKGFEQPPADHYARPFWLALEENSERDEKGLCSRSTFMVNYTLDYLLSYFSAYPDNLKFAFSFMSYITHARPNLLSFADNELLRVLRTFVEKKYHENTVIVIFGDHGSRNDEIRNTMQGKLEERLPWLSISVPAWLEEKYPDITSALEHNQHVISSPFDLHATLHHLLTYPNEPQGEKTQSLFTKLENFRTCTEAGEMK